MSAALLLALALSANAGGRRARDEQLSGEILGLVEGAEAIGLPVDHPDPQALYRLAGEACLAQEDRDTDRAATVALACGDALYRTGSFLAAHDAYVAASGSPDDALAREAAERAIWAAGELVKQGSDRASSGPWHGPPEPFTVNERRAVEAFDRFLLRFPDDGRARTYLLYRGMMHFSRRQFVEATADFERLIAAYPDDSVAEQAARYLVDAHRAREDWLGVEVEASRLLEHPTLLLTARGRTELERARDEAAARRGEPPRPCSD